MEATYIDHMGDDLRVVNAARVSFNKESSWLDVGGEWLPDEYEDGSLSRSLSYNPVLELKEEDKKLIKYLATHNHWTPFSHCMITMREKVPIFVARQRFKHMVGFTYNEVSRRYVKDDPEFYQPDEWRAAPKGNAKQGSSNKTINLDKLSSVSGLYSGNYCEGTLEEELHYVMRDSVSLYENMIKGGVAPEMARMVLPQAMYTEYYVTGSLAAWARAYKLRIDAHAQKEIQELAKQWDEIIRPLFPVSWSALVDD